MKKKWWNPNPTSLPLLILPNRNGPSMLPCQGDFKSAGPTISHKFLFLLVISFSFNLLSCEPEDLVNSYFEQMGLTRLAVLRTDVQPGTIIRGARRRF